MANQQYSTPLRFGIIELDKLLSRSSSISIDEFGGIDVQKDERTSVCILGPDGCGKSILALHLASSYRASTKDQPIRVIYFSTDLSFKRANQTWLDFGLGKPKKRLDVLPRFAKAANFAAWYESFPDDLLLECMQPFGRSSADHRELPDMLLEDIPQKDSVTFIDSETQTTGDDWLFLQRLVSVLPHPKNDPHLLVIDAVEGLEPVPGGPDSFGEIRAGRTRIAQLIRAAKGKCHIVYVVEEPKAGEHLDSQYVTDVVMRLRTVTTGTYSRRSVEIEKARGHQHVRGQHDIVIRKGTGSTTGRDTNPDDPEVLIEEKNPLAYIHILRSVHSLSRELLERRKGQNPQINPDQQEVFSFGIPYLDRLLPKVISGPLSSAGGQGGEIAALGLGGILRAEFSPKKEPEHPRGLIGGSVNALIGPLTTYKSRVGRAFLSRAVAECFLSISHIEKKDLSKHNHMELGKGGGIAVLLTTLPMDSSVLLRECLVHLGHEKDWIDELEKLGGSGQDPNAIWTRVSKNRLICRRLEVHHLTAEGAIHLVTSVIREAQIRLLEEGAFVKAADNDADDNIRLACRRIRLVVDDWNLIKKAYPEATEDHLLLPYFVHFFKREGITTLFIDTEPGIPLSPSIDADTQLRTLTSQHIYTWVVPFSGERRVAITSAPPTSASLPSTTYELRPVVLVQEGRREDAYHNERVVVDPHFEMYSGLETEGRIERVPLKVKLYGESSTYFHGMKPLLEELFHSVADEDVMSIVDPPGYELLRDYAYLQDNVRMDHTLVMQVDEFWSETHQSLFDLTEFMIAQVGAGDPTVREIEDPYRLHALARTNSSEVERWRSFDVFGNDYSKYFKLPITIDKCPYLWDFGFLLANRNTWLAAMTENPGELFRIPADEGAGNLGITVENTWNALTFYDIKTGKNLHRSKGKGRPSGKIEEGDLSATISWEAFLKVCEMITPAGERSFDVDLRTIEVLSCFVLEVWLSLVRRRIKANIKGDASWTKFDTEFTKTFCRVRHMNARDNCSLHEMLTRYPCMESDLFFALCLVFQHVGGLSMQNVDLVPRRALKNATAARHYYSTACDQEYNDGSLVQMRLPGHYCVRGDWFLAMGKGSRSPRLGERAIDLLCSTRSNLARLQEGIGLPVRTIVEGDVRTALLASKSEDISPYTEIEMVLYDELKSLAPDSTEEISNYNFLWRSGIKYYDLNSRGWLRWIGRVWQIRNRWLTRIGPDVLANDKSGETPRDLSPCDRSFTVRDKMPRFKEEGVGLLKNILKRTSQT